MPASGSKGRVKPIILVFTGYYLPGYKAGGILRNVINTIDNLCDEVEFRVITRDRDLGDKIPFSNIKPDEWQGVGNASVYYLPPESNTTKKISQLIANTDHDAIFLTSYFDPLTIKVLLNRALRFDYHKPIIVAPFGEFAWASLRQKLSKKLIFIAFARLLGLYNKVVWRVSSAYEARDLQRIMRPDPGSIRITGDLPIKIDLTSNASSKALNDQIGSGALRVIFLSRISREKNLNIALKILQKVRARVDFDIFGPTENSSYWRECQELIEDLPTNVTAQYCGNVHPSKVLDVFGCYDLFLFPTGGEAYGNVIAESLTAGTPVLISTNTPWRNLVQAGLGWDVDLKYLDSYVDVIEQLALQSESQRLMAREVVRKCIRDRLFDADVLESNRRLFNI